MRESSSQTVLILEDQPLISLEFEELLTEAGVDQVVCLRSGKEALAWLDEHTPSAVLADIQLRDGDGRDVLLVLRDRAIPCLIHSASPIPGDWDRDLELTFPRIDKPANPSVVVQHLMMILAGGQFSPEG